MEETGQTGRRSAWIRAVKYALFLSLSSALLFAVVGEIYVRLSQDEPLPTPEELRRRSLRYEPAVFARHVLAREKVEAHGWNGARWQINELGYRGRAFRPDKQAGTYRIVFYGGSSVFDSFASGKDDWPHRVERWLRAHGRESVEVINAGVPGHASFDALGRLFAEGHRFEPDCVVLYAAWNDIKTFRSSEPLLRQIAPWSEGLDPRIHYTGELDRGLCQLSQLYLLLRGWYQRETRGLGEEGRVPGGEPGDRIQPEALAQYRLGLEAFADLARNIGALPVFVLQARLVHPDNTRAQRERIRLDYVQLTHEALCRAFAETDRITRLVAAEKGALLIDSTSAMCGQEAFFLDHVHLNEAGSRRLAELVGEGLVSELKNKTHSPDAQGGGNPYSSANASLK
ncbi:MAG: SGNH/GDSL hydrolase family protein [Deltaproteobacteria bacterium]|nr:SGNH/GDSL hydrolase family protein [Deltaproteobacteria bacterium]